MSIIILLSVLAAFRINNREVGELFFSVNNLTRSPPRFSIEIFEVVGGSMAGRFRITTYRELRDLAIFLGYNPMAFYSNRIFSSRRLISRALV
jgi:hypothetical protein